MGIDLRHCLVLFSIILIGITACGSADTSSPDILESSPCPTCPPTTPVPAISATQTPEPTTTPEPRTLTICLGSEPDTLFYYESSMYVTNNVWEAIYDGPIDTLNYSYRPVILEKLPSLADGDARIEAVSVRPGDRVVSNDGQVIDLDAGDVVRPFGCNQSDCAVIFDGESIEMGQLSADFTLLENVRWDDGKTLTTADTVFSYLIAQQCDTQLEWCANNSLVERTADYIALDDRTARWIGLPGFMDPHYETNFYHPLPEHQFINMPIGEMATSIESSMLPMGWGPYKIEEWVIGDEIRMNKNPFYFRAQEGLPRFDRLVFKFIGENSPLNISKILAGECDLVDQKGVHGDVIHFLDWGRQGLLQVQVSTGSVFEHLDFSLQHADYDDGYQVGLDRADIFGDVRTRQAIAMCLDRERVINEAVFQVSDYDRLYQDPGHPLFQKVYGISDAPNTYIASDHPLYNPEVSVYHFNPIEASLLLEEVGWIDHDGDSRTSRQARSVPNVLDGTLLEFNYWTTEAELRRKISRILAESFSECGIKINVQHWKPAEFFTLPDSPVFSRNFDLVEFAWISGVIPPCDLFLSENIPGDPGVLNPDGSPRFPRGWDGENNSGYSSSAFDKACNAAMALLPGQPGFVENHLLAQEIFARDLPVIPLFQRLKVSAAQNELCGHWLDATENSDTWNIEQYGFGDECEH